VEETRVKFERESWRKLYVRESVEHRMMSLFARGLRDYLLRHAEPDGTVLPQTKTPASDLGRVLNALPNERKLVEKALEELLRVGFLAIDRGRLWIPRFTEAQAAKSPNAKRQAELRARRRDSGGNVTESVTSNVTESVTSNVTESVTETLQVTLQKDETRRDETTLPQTPAAPPEPTLADRARKVLENPHDGQFSQPSKWPEVQRNALSMSEPWGIRDLKLTDFPPRDADLRAILEAYAAGYSPDQLDEAGRRAKADPYFQTSKKRGPAAFTPAVLRRLLAEKNAEVMEWRD
jgi:hypothetical protein